MEINIGKNALFRPRKDHIPALIFVFLGRLFSTICESRGTVSTIYPSSKIRVNCQCWQIRLLCTDPGFVKWTFEILGQLSEDKPGMDHRESRGHKYRQLHVPIKVAGSSIYVFVRGKCSAFFDAMLRELYILS